MRAVLERAVERVERAERLDAPGYQLEHGLALTFLLAGRWSRPLQDLLHGRWLGHPLHPALVTLPVGAWTAAGALDLADLLARGADLRRRAHTHSPGSASEAAQGAVLVGLAGAVAAAAAGWTDWQHSHDEARRVGLVHAALNGAATGLYGWSALVRGARPRRAQALAGLGWVVVLASSHLGGTLPYRHRQGVDHSDPLEVPRSATLTVPLATLPDGVPTGLQLDGAPVAAVREGDRVRAVGGRCPHLGAPLAQGWLAEGQLVCPWHGSRFDLDTGQPARGPATAPAPCLDADVRDGRVQLRRRADWRSPTAATTRRQASR